MNFYAVRTVAETFPSEDESALQTYMADKREVDFTVIRADNSLLRNYSDGELHSLCEASGFAVVITR